MMKFFILYNLYVEKYKEMKKDGAGFFDFVRRFFEEKDTTEDRSEAVQIGLSGGFKFSIHLLREIRVMSPKILHSSLEYMYQNIRSASPMSLYGIDKTFFVADQSMNEARGFLQEIFEDSNQQKETRELALRLIVVVGVLRANSEDYILAINLMEKHKFECDLSEEIGRVTFDVEESALNPSLFSVIEKVK